MLKKCLTFSGTSAWLVCENSAVKKIRHQENFLSYGQCFLAVLFPGLRISRGIFNPFSVRYLWCGKQLTLASRQEDKLQLKIDRSLFIFLLRLFTLQKTEPSTKFSVQYNNCLITLSIVFEFYVMNCERLCYELHKFLMCGWEPHLHGRGSKDSGN